MELKQRYIQAVTNRLPDKKRDEVKKELEDLIEGMLKEKEQDIEEVLKQIGPPSLVAKKYLKKRYVISAEFFDTYFCFKVMH